MRLRSNTTGELGAPGCQFLGPKCKRRHKGLTKEERKLVATDSACVLPYKTIEYSWVGLFDEALLRRTNITTSPTQSVGNWSEMDELWTNILITGRPPDGGIIPFGSFGPAQDLD